jgi:hypothetical protein
MKKNKFYIRATIFLLLVSFCYQSAYPQANNNTNVFPVKNRGIKEYGLEFLGATIGQFVINIPATIASVLFFGPVLLSSGDNGTANIGFRDGAVYIVVNTVGASLGTLLTGKIIHQKGSRLGAWTGGLLGAGLGFSTILIYDMANRNQLQYNWGILLPVSYVLSPLCAVAGYNLLGSKNSSQSLLNKNMPQFSLTIKPEKYQNKILPKFGVNILYNF